MSKTISILGSTGSIGRQTLDVVDDMGLNVAAITAHSSVDRMEEQVRRYRPRLAVMTDEAAARELAVRVADTETKVLGGFDALEEAATVPEADTVVTAVVGMVGLKPTLAAIGEKKRLRRRRSPPGRRFALAPLQEGSGYKPPEPLPRPQGAPHLPPGRRRLPGREEPFLSLPGPRTPPMYLPAVWSALRCPPPVLLRSLPGSTPAHKRSETGTTFSFRIPPRKSFLKR